VVDVSKLHSNHWALLAWWRGLGRECAVYVSSVPMVKLTLLDLIRCLLYSEALVAVIAWSFLVNVENLVPPIIILASQHSDDVNELVALCLGRSAVIPRASSAMKMP
jgi:hypothetical protein